MKLFRSFTLLVWLISTGSVWAVVEAPPPHPLSALLSETLPTAFPPVALTEADLEVRVSPGKLALEASVEAGSIEWARYAEAAVGMRARLRIRLTGLRSGQIVRAAQRGSDRVDLWQVGAGKSEIEAPYLFGFIGGVGEQLVLDVEGRRATVEVALKKPLSPLVDHSCSRFRAHVRTLEPEKVHTPRGPVTVGCKLVESSSARDGEPPVLEVWVSSLGRTWSGALPASESVGLTVFRVSSEHSTLVLRDEASQETVSLEFSIPRDVKKLGLAIGLGPYRSEFESPTQDRHTVTVVPTLYGGYTVTETVRLVSFMAGTLTPERMLDLGFYVQTESFRVLDRRVGLYLMLGIHGVGFKSPELSGYQFRFGGPQGLELQVSDFLSKGKNLLVGGFVFPKIDGKSYSNIWIRYGMAQGFIELNGISWDEQVSGKDFRSSNYGISVGFPFARFL